MNLYYLKLGQIFLYEKVDQAPITFEVVSITTSLWSLFKTTTTVRTSVFQNRIDTIFTKGTFVTANHRFFAVWGKRNTTMFAVGLER